MATFRLKNILVPIDFSITSRHALRHAERIGHEMHARITLLHVIEPFLDSMSLDVGTVASAARIMDEMQRLGTERLQRIAQASTKRSGGTVHVVTALGRVAPTIGKTATDLRCELIVMGTHGSSGFVENMLGSNSYRVATVSRTPLLSIHKPMRRFGYRHIVYPVRDTVRATDKFTHALAFARMFNGSVHLVGLSRPGVRSSEDRIRASCTALQKRFQKNRIKADMTVFNNTHPADGVMTFMDSYPGALVVINQDRDVRLVELFGKTFPKKILHNLVSPVLTIPNR